MWIVSRVKIQRALLSVSDKTGLVAFAKILTAAGVELISTGGTAKTLREAGLAVKDISEHTGFPEMLDGRVKTLHPKVHGGLLYIRGNAAHEAAVKEHAITPIDLVVVNLYPFEATVAKPDVKLHDAIENIDIGGPSMLRSAAKNHDSVTVVVDPFDYAEVAKQITENGNTTLEFRRRLCAKVFARTAAYDAAIAAHLQKEFAADKNSLPLVLTISAPLAQPLRYGENPHQTAALYGKFHDFFKQLHGKELSYNNILDLTAAAALIAEFREDAADTGDSEAHQSVRRRPGREFARSLGQGVRHGQTGAVWRHHRGEPAARRCMRGGDCGDFQRGDRCTGIFGGSAGDFAEEKKSSPAANPEMSAVRAAVGCAQRGRGFIFAAAA